MISRVLAAVFAVPICISSVADEPPNQLRVGIIGLDTSHVVVFTDLIQNAKPGSELAGLRVVAAFAAPSRLESSAERIPQYTKDLRAKGVDIVGSLAELLQKVDVVLLESADGHSHLELVRPVLQARKPVFIDKPAAGSLTDALVIFQLAKAKQVPVFSSSSLRFYEGPAQARAGEFGEVLGCDTYGRCVYEPSLPDLYWYGIHGIEMLYACMGTGCESVTRVASEDLDFVTGKWADGRMGAYRGLRKGKAEFGGTVFGSRSIASLNTKSGYEPMLNEIARFFRTGRPPVSPEETIEILAFMDAADESKRLGGHPVFVKSVLEAANERANRISD
jgi:hypothetical protein